MKKIGIIGCGNMGEAIIAGARRKFSLVVSETCRKRQAYLKKAYRITTRNLKDLLNVCDVVILAVKPQSIDGLLSQLKDFDLKGKLLVSIAAGITTKYLEKRVDKKTRIVRAMPNLPAKVKKSVTALSSGTLSTRKDLKFVQSIFDTIGTTVVVQENLMDSITAVSGSGPGYIYLFVEQMISAAKTLGLSEKVATSLVVQSFDGSIELLKSSKDDAKTLRDKVTSRGGTTQAGISVFEQKKIGLIFKQALKAAQKRSKMLSKG